MKKKILIILVLFLLTGCDNYQIKCTSESKEEKYKAKIEFNYIKNEIKEARLTLTFDDKKSAKENCDIMSLYKTDKITIECKDKTVIVNGYQYIDLDATSKVYDKDKMMENLNNQGYSCK